MKIMNCPLNGPRNISEFAWGGEVKQMPDPASVDDPQSVALVVDPLSTAHVFFMKIPEMCNRTAKTRESQLRRHPEDL